jgi:sugar phosphate isomerase/epimerase
MEQWFASLGRHLVEVHLHDNDGTADAHQAVGQGIFDFERFFLLMTKGTPVPVFTIEAHDKDDVETSLDRVRMLMANGKITTTDRTA